MNERKEYKTYTTNAQIFFDFFSPFLSLSLFFFLNFFIFLFEFVLLFVFRLVQLLAKDRCAAMKEKAKYDDCHWVSEIESEKQRSRTPIEQTIGRKFNIEKNYSYEMEWYEHLKCVYRERAFKLLWIIKGTLWIWLPFYRQHTLMHRHTNLRALFFTHCKMLNVWQIFNNICAFLIRLWRSKLYFKLLQCAILLGLASPFEKSFENTSTYRWKCQLFQ